MLEGSITCNVSSCSRIVFHHTRIFSSLLHIGKKKKRTWSPNSIHQLASSKPLYTYSNVVAALHKINNLAHYSTSFKVMMSKIKYIYKKLFLGLSTSYEQIWKYGHCSIDIYLITFILLSTYLVLGDKMFLHSTSCSYIDAHMEFSLIEAMHHISLITCIFLECNLWPYSQQIAT